MHVDVYTVSAFCLLSCLPDFLLLAKLVYSIEYKMPHLPVCHVNYHSTRSSLNLISRFVLVLLVLPVYITTSYINHFTYLSSCHLLDTQEAVIREHRIYHDPLNERI